MDLDIKVTGMPTYELLFHLNSDFLSFNIALKTPCITLTVLVRRAKHNLYLVKPKCGLAKIWNILSYHYSFSSLYAYLHQVLNLGGAFKYVFDVRFPNVRV